MRSTSSDIQSISMVFAITVIGLLNYFVGFPPRPSGIHDWRAFMDYAIAFGALAALCYIVIRFFYPVRLGPDPTRPDPYLKAVAEIESEHAKKPPKDLISATAESVKINDGYDCFRELVENLRSEGFTVTSGLMDYMLKSEWPSSPEFIGKLGTEILAFEKMGYRPISDELRCSLDKCMAAVRKVCPDIQ